MPLLEKAYAKLHGTYEDIMYHNIKECLVDMTGGIASQVEFEDYIKNSKRLLDLGSAHLDGSKCQQQRLSNFL